MNYYKQTDRKEKVEELIDFVNTQLSEKRYPRGKRILEMMNKSAR